jgi:hypothetical protein
MLIAQLVVGIALYANNIEDQIELWHGEAAENEGDEKEGRREENNLEKDKYISVRSKLYLELDYISQRESSAMAVLRIFPKGGHYRPLLSVHLSTKPPSPRQLHFLCPISAFNLLWQF